MSAFAEVAVVQSIQKLAEEQGCHEHWLPFASSPALICCLGAGPWKYGRRRKVQFTALELLRGRDIGELPQDVVFFPLTWQNQMLQALVKTLQPHGKPRDGAMVSFVSELRSMEPSEARDRFYQACGRPGGTKVLSLYLRDYVGVPCFPVDRHVRRSLETLGLPTKEQELLDLFRRASVDPVPVARWLGTKDLSGGNPNWRAWPNRAAPESP